MKKENADKWVTALRSKKYEQGKSFLQSLDGKFCCLGVLLDINGIKPMDKGTDAYKYAHEGPGVTNPFGVLAPDHMKQCDLKSSYGEFTEGNNRFVLTRLNDEGHTFNEIADIIEKHWEEL